MVMMVLQSQQISQILLLKNLNFPNKSSSKYKLKMVTVHKSIWILKINLSLES